MAFSHKNSGAKFFATEYNALADALSGLGSVDGLLSQHTDDVTGASPATFAILPSVYNTVEGGGSTPKVGGFYLHYGDQQTTGQLGGRQNRVAYLGYNVAWNDTAVISTEVRFRDRWETYYTGPSNLANVRWLERHVGAFSPAGSSTRFCPINAIITTTNVATADPVSMGVQLCEDVAILDRTLATTYFAANSSGISLNRHTTLDYGHYFYLGLNGGGSTPALSVSAINDLHFHTPANLYFDSDAGTSYIILQEAQHINTGTTTGTKIGTATTQKIGFWNATPVVQFSTTGTTTGFTAGAGTAAKSDSTYTGNSGTKAYTVGDIVLALKTCGIMAAS